MRQKTKTVDPEVRAEKAKRLAVAATAAGVLLFLFFLVIMVIQFVKIANRNAELRELQDRIAEYEQLIGEGEKDLEYYRSQFGLYELALKAGWSKP